MAFTNPSLPTVNGRLWPTCFSTSKTYIPTIHSTDVILTRCQRGETDFFSGEPLRALSTLVFSENIDLQRSASLTFAEITERGMWMVVETDAQ